VIEIGANPIAFLGVSWYGIIIALGIIGIILWLLREIRRGNKISAETVITAALVGIPSGIIFSRLLHVIDRWDHYFQNPGQIIGGDGLTAYGAILGAALGIWIYSRVSKLNFGYFADLAAPAIILAQAIGRIGCTLNGCCYGLPTSLPWGIIYTHGKSFGYEDSNALLPGMGLHPTQVYELIYNLIVFGVLLKLRGHFKPDGSLFLIYLSLYAAYRIGSDFLREGTSFFFGLHQAQFISIIILAITIPLLIYRTRWVSTDNKVDQIKEA